MEDDSIDMEDDLNMTVSIWKMTVSVCKMTVSIWYILSLCKRGPATSTTHELSVTLVHRQVELLVSATHVASSTLNPQSIIGPINPRPNGEQGLVQATRPG